MRKTLFWFVMVVLLAAAAAAGAGTYWELFDLNKVGLDKMGVTRDTAELGYWGLTGGVVGYLLGSILVPKSRPAAASK